MIKKLMAIAVAGFLLVGASSGMAARVVDVWLVVGFESASGTEYLDPEAEPSDDICMKAIQKLTVENGFQFVASNHVEPRLVALFFAKSGDKADNAVLSCLANIIEEQL